MCDHSWPLTRRGLGIYFGRPEMKEIKDRARFWLQKPEGRDMVGWCHGGTTFSVRLGWIGFWTLTSTVLRECSWEMAMGVQKLSCHTSLSIGHAVAILEDLHHWGLTLLNFCYAITFLGELHQPFFGMASNYHIRAVCYFAALSWVQTCPFHPSGLFFTRVQILTCSRMQLSLRLLVVEFHLRILAFKNQKKIQVQLWNFSHYNYLRHTFQKATGNKIFQQPDIHL